MKNDFCFVIITRNQEGYIFQHLESIKYQICKYGCNRKIQLVLSDDASSDNTVTNAKKWIACNEIFNQVDIVEHLENIGTIRNIYDSLEKVDSNEFKLLAGDDLYNEYNIFDVSLKADMIITPTIAFDNNRKTYNNSLNPYFLRMIRSEKKKKDIRNMLDYAQVINAPGVFLKKEIWLDKGMRDFVMQYKYIEDIPMWHYLFNVTNTNFSLLIDENPYILYRKDVGVMSTIKNDNPISQEYVRMRKEIPSNENIKPKILNIYNYEQYIKNLFIEKITSKYNNNILRSINKYKAAYKRVPSYLDIIFKEANKYED